MGMYGFLFAVLVTAVLSPTAMFCRFSVLI